MEPLSVKAPETFGMKLERERERVHRRYLEMNPITCLIKFLLFIINWYYSGSYSPNSSTSPVKEKLSSKEYPRVLNENSSTLGRS